MLTTNEQFFHLSRGAGVLCPKRKRGKGANHFQLFKKRVHYIPWISPPLKVKVGPLTYGDGNMRIQKFYEILGLKGTVKILKYLDEHGKARYIDLSSIISYASLNTRLTQLENLNLIEHHFDRGKKKREEWYELTEKGKKFILIFNQLEEMINE